MDRWRGLAGPAADALCEKLVAAWNEPQRVYHDLSHLVWLLDEAERKCAVIQDAVFVGYAIWFHDAVYQPGRSDNEDLSAAWARSALIEQPRLAERVARVIEMTKSHADASVDGDEALFLDMAVLGARREVYRAYASAVRREFGAFPDPVFAAGRGRFLEGQLSRERLFHSEVYQTECGAAARANMVWELEELRGERFDTC